MENSLIAKSGGKCYGTSAMRKNKTDRTRDFFFFYFFIVFFFSIGKMSHNSVRLMDSKMNESVPTNTKKKIRMGKFWAKQKTEASETFNYVGGVKCSISRFVCLSFIKTFCRIVNFRLKCLQNCTIPSGLFTAISSSGIQWYNI